MFDYQVSKHPHFDEACRAFALRHNLVQLAERAGMNVQILRNKLNPAQPHLLTAPEIWLLTDLTEDSTLVNQQQKSLLFPGRAAGWDLIIRVAWIVLPCTEYVHESCRYEQLLRL